MFTQSGDNHPEGMPGTALDTSIQVAIAAPSGTFHQVVSQFAGSSGPFPPTLQSSIFQFQYPKRHKAVLGVPVQGTVM